MQPDIVYQSPQTAGKKAKFNPPIKSFIVVIPVVLIALFFAFFSNFSKLNLSSLFKSPVPAKISIAVSKPTTADFHKALVRDIQSSFKSSKDAGVMAYVTLAATEKDAAQSYQYYVQAFNKMMASYQQPKKEPVTADSARDRIQQKIAMIELKAYASSLPNYKESDFTLPK